MEVKNGSTTNGSGHKRRGRARKLTPEREAALFREWAYGTSYANLARQFGVSTTTVTNVINRSAEQ